MVWKRVQQDIQEALASATIKFRDVNVRTALELDPEKRPWNKAQAIFIGAISNAPVIRWVDTGLLVSWYVIAQGAPVVPTPIASFTIGKISVLNQENFKSFAPRVRRQGSSDIFE